MKVGTTLGSRTSATSSDSVFCIGYDVEVVPTAFLTGLMRSETMSQRWQRIGRQFSLSHRMGEGRGEGFFTPVPWQSLVDTAKQN
jgi:hypothetical protein